MIKNIDTSTIAMDWNDFVKIIDFSNSEVLGSKASVNRNGITNGDEVNLDLNTMIMPPEYILNREFGKVGDIY